jgi:hypothetical protein
MSDRLAKLEAQIEKFVEGTLNKLLAGRLQAREVAVRLARAMEDNAQTGLRDQRMAPTHYHVRINPDDAAVIRATTPDLTDGLCAELVVFARELGLSLPGQPVIIIEPDPSVEPTGIVVEAVSTPIHSDTRPMTLPQGATSNNPAKAYLIINGDRHIPLNRPVITIGRKLDNTIIVDDPRCSRHHAQLRQRYGRWVLYDLGSASGTLVNNETVEEYLLQPGDVIALAGTTLIYAEEESDNPDDTGGTLPLPARADPPPKL